jgi:hypothetical protein
MAVIIELRDPHWISDRDTEHDLCAHGGVEIRVNDIVFSDGIDTNWTVSAAALHLLRTLTRDHTKEHPICENLIPCCGFNMYEQGEGEDVLLLECSYGTNFEVKHYQDKVILTNQNSEKTTITNDEWQQSVFLFADAVENFYRLNEPKQTQDEIDPLGYDAFWKEWKCRRHAA